MWCRQCQQDVAARDRDERHRPLCPRCGAGLAGIPADRADRPAETSSASRHVSSASESSASDHPSKRLDDTAEATPATSRHATLYEPGWDEMTRELEELDSFTRTLGQLNRTRLHPPHTLPASDPAPDTIGPGGEAQAATSSSDAWGQIRSLRRYAATLGLLVAAFQLTMICLGTAGLLTGNTRLALIASAGLQATLAGLLLAWAAMVWPASDRNRDARRRSRPRRGPQPHRPRRRLRPDRPVVDLPPPR